MSRARVVLATKSYWPHVSEPARACERLAWGLADCGAEVRVVSAQFNQGLQGTYWDGEVPVVRLPHGPNSWWGPMRYWFALADWLRSHRESYDVVCVSGLHYDAYSAWQALAQQPQPLVLRAELGGLGGDCQWQATARFGGRVKHCCQQAHAIIATTESIAVELDESGYDSAQITTIVNGLDPLPFRSEMQRQAAKRTALATLGEAHGALRPTAGAPVVLCLEPIHDTQQLPPLLAFWKSVATRSPTAQLWMIGQGRAYEVIPRLAERHNLELSIAAPGMFDDLTELFEAADLLLLPFDTGGQSWAALEAMAMSLPVIGTDCPGNRELLVGGKLGHLFSMEEAAAAGRFVGWLHDLKSLTEVAATAREHIVQKHSVEQMAQRHLALFERLLSQIPHPQAS